MSSGSPAKQSAEAAGAKPAKDKDATGLPRGEIWVMSKKQIKRLEGSFSDYKKMIKQKIEKGENPDM